MVRWWRARICGPLSLYTYSAELCDLSIASQLDVLIYSDIFLGFFDLLKKGCFFFRERFSSSKYLFISFTLYTITSRYRYTRDRLVSTIFNLPGKNHHVFVIRLFNGPVQTMLCGILEESFSS